MRVSDRCLLRLSVCLRLDLRLQRPGSLDTLGQDIEVLADRLKATCTAIKRNVMALRC